MDDEARTRSGLDPVRQRGPRVRSPWGRRSPQRRDGAEGNAARREHPYASYAALDLGTNNCRLLVARPSGDSFRVVDAFSRIIRLGEGLSSTGRLSEAAITRALDALTICRDKMRHRGVTRARLITTEACRIAANGEQFLARVRDEIGLSLEIVDRETEALLAATGCTPLVDPQAHNVILFDIGGGSSELVKLGQRPASDGGPPFPEVQAWASLPVGVVTLAERHGGIHVDRSIYEAMVDEVAAHVRPFAATHGHASPLDAVHMLGTSGTVTTIAGVHLKLERYDRRRVDGCWMSDDQVCAVMEQLLAMSYEERVANPCIGSERADLVLAGCAILEAIRRAFPCIRLRVADRGLREGILVQLMREDGVWQSSREQTP